MRVLSVILYNDDCDSYSCKELDHLLYIVITLIQEEQFCDKPNLKLIVRDTVEAVLQKYTSSQWENKVGYHHCWSTVFTSVPITKTAKIV